MMFTWNEISLTGELLVRGASYMNLSTLIEVIFVAVQASKNAFFQVAVEAAGDQAVWIAADDKAGKIRAGHQKSGVFS